MHLDEGASVVRGSITELSPFVLTDAPHRPVFAQHAGLFGAGCRDGDGVVQLQHLNRATLCIGGAVSELTPSVCTPAPDRTVGLQPTTVPAACGHTNFKRYGRQEVTSELAANGVGGPIEPGLLPHTLFDALELASRHAWVTLVS